MHGYTDICMKTFVYIHIVMQLIVSYDYYIAITFNINTSKLINIH